MAWISSSNRTKDKTTKARRKSSSVCRRCGASNGPGLHQMPSGCLRQLSSPEEHLKHNAISNQADFKSNLSGKRYPFPTQKCEKNPTPQFFLKDILNANSIKIPQTTLECGILDPVTSLICSKYILNSLHCADRCPPQRVNQDVKPRKGEEIRKNPSIAL
ncbi:hypothetical protein AVEN_169780-1 [Araneus ventricosus]|uniref:Uncharacterized protein n=1 Tax=Araneus ventricosus TaxID=182803 RepID=A0A4Y2HL72_ARAVE|nr:hypothetical protein AVEN_169780-1 [Araneus ventricosus]